MADNHFPKLRPLDVRPIVQNGQHFILLRDPLQLSENNLLIPRSIAPVLGLLDGSRDTRALSASLAIRYGIRVAPTTLEQLTFALDEAIMLENNRYSDAREEALYEYRNAPYRPPSLGGVSYPDDANSIKTMLQEYVDGVEIENGNASGFSKPRGLVCPHIDYPRGGPVYARVWTQVKDIVREADLVIILGTDHFGVDGQLFTLTQQNYSTPWGALPTEMTIVADIATKLGTDNAFQGELFHKTEHSIELAAVWLHHVRDGKPCEIVPILCGSFNSFLQSESLPENDPSIDIFVETLKPVVLQKNAVVVAAGDLSHVGPAFGGDPLDQIARGRLKTTDELLLKSVCEGDAQSFFSDIREMEDKNNVCGVAPIYLAMKLLEPVKGEQVDYMMCPADELNTSFVSICGLLFE